MQAPHTLLSLIRTHPYQTALHTINGAIFLEPRIATVPTFWALGFGRRGPQKGTAVHLNWLYVSLLIAF